MRSAWGSPGLSISLITAAIVPARAPGITAAAAGVLAWAAAIALYGFLGLHGLSGDRLFVIMKDQADLSQAVGMQDRNERLTYVYKTLTDQANATQGPIRQSLDRFGPPICSM